MKRQTRQLERAVLVLVVEVRLSRADYEKNYDHDSLQPGTWEGL
jgi:hypothetical protein